MSQYTDEVHETYPCLQCWIHINRDTETGNTRILVFDIQRSQDDPVYEIAISPRDLLISGGGMVLPCMTFEQYDEFLKSGKLPEGYLTYGEKSQ